MLTFSRLGPMVQAVLPPKKASLANAPASTGNRLGGERIRAPFPHSSPGALSARSRPIVPLE
ncbi:MAG TPA: hypothetical protein VFD73_20000, partial [Gemmatimonadales bacterium]|nr:hypothetical protein [Gemmatimonadales bacterium]